MDWHQLLKSLDDPNVCELCGARTAELRRGRCWSCYARWADSRPAGYGASCVGCGERRLAYLKLIELLGSWLPLCGNCSLRVARFDRVPPSLDALRFALARNRRFCDRRRGLVDHRPERVDRRGLERRTVGAYPTDEICVDDHPEIVIELDDWDIEIDVGEPQEDTRIVRLV